MGGGSRFFIIKFNVQKAVFCDRQIKLGNLVVLWQIGVKILLAIELAVGCNLTGSINVLGGSPNLVELGEKILVLVFSWQ